MAFSHRADKEPVYSELVRKIIANGKHFRYRYTRGYNTRAVGKVLLGYCENVIQPKTCVEQSWGQDSSYMILMHSVCYILPDYMYFICGRKVYTWLSPNSEGLCYLGRVLSGIMTITHDHIVNIHRNSSPPYIHTHHKHI